MKLAFHEMDGSLLSRIIAVRTNSSLTHCELLFSNGDTYSSIIDVGTRFTDGSVLQEPPGWKIVDIGPVDEDALRDACHKRIGQTYGLIGCACFLLDIPDFQPRQTFCSQECTLMLQTQGIFRAFDPTQTSPQELYIAALARAEALAAICR